MNEINAATASIYEQLGLNNTTESKDNDELGQEEFLKLMTTQLSNQDPFAPMENGEFLAQMAQFGTVSGINELQESFGALADALQSDRALQASSMVGKTVIVPSDVNALGEEQPLRGAVDLPSSVTDLKLNILGLNGQFLTQIPLGPQGPGQVEFNWDGTLDDGSKALPGSYRVAAEALVGGQTQAFDVLATAQVNSVSLGGSDDEIMLSLAGIGEVGMSEVKQIK